MSRQSNNTTGRQSGRILLHQRDVNDDAPILGGDPIISDELGAKYEDEYQDTILKNMEDDTRKDYRRRLVRICNYWETSCPMYYSTGARIVPEAEYTDRNKFFYNGRYKKDVVYAGLNVKFFVKFLMENKTLKNGMLKSLMDTRKYMDVIMWGTGVL